MMQSDLDSKSKQSEFFLCIMTLTEKGSVLERNDFFFTFLGSTFFRFFNEKIRKFHETFELGADFDS